MEAQRGWHKDGGTKMVVRKMEAQRWWQKDGGTKMTAVR
jgi:hypothetical protein